MTNMSKADINKIALQRKKEEERAHAGVRDKVDKLITFFGEAKIASFKTLDNVLEDLTSRRKNTVEEGEET